MHVQRALSSSRSPDVHGRSQRFRPVAVNDGCGVATLRGMNGHQPYRTRPLHPALQPYVTSLVAYDVAMGGPGVHRGLPSTSLTFVLPLGEPLDVSWPGEPASRARRWSVVSGLHATPAAIHHDGHQTGIQLGLTPTGARALFGIPPAALCHELAELDELHATPREELRQLPERLHGTDDWQERLRRTHEALLTALARHGRPGPRAEIGRALARLTQGLPVADVADEVGWSRRHLTTQFRAELGLNPKAYQRVARFQTAHRLLLRAARRGRPSLADVAADAGYADQAHLTREWAELAGCTPVQWLSEEFPFLQDSVLDLDEGDQGRRHRPSSTDT